MSSIVLKAERKQYFNDEYNGTECPECGGLLIPEENSVLLSIKSSFGQEQFMTNVPEGTFCKDCPVVVFDRESVEEAARFAVRGKKNVQYTVMGIVDLEATEKQRLKTRTNFSSPGGNPIVAEKKTGRNEPCPCSSGKKYKKCCGK